MTSRAIVVFGACFAIVACAAPGPRYVLERPIAKKCDGTGLQRCPDLTDGEPPAPHARPSTSAVAADAPPADVVARNPAELPANPYTRVLAKADGAPRPLVVAEAARASAADPEHWHTETTVPVAHVNARSCAPGGAFAPRGDQAKGRCVRVLKGPFVLTDLHAPGGCAADLFAIGGSVSEPRWMMHVPATTSLHASGTVLSVGERDYLVIGATASSDSRLKGDVRCSITWTAWKESGFDSTASESGL